MHFPIETCPKCGAQGVAFICSTPGCPVNGGAAYHSPALNTPVLSAERRAFIVAKAALYRISINTSNPVKIAERALKDIATLIPDAGEPQ